MRSMLWSALLLLACGNAAEERAKLAELEKKADQRVAQAEKAGREKLEEAQKQLEQVKADYVKLRTNFEDAAKAQASSETLAKQFEAALSKARKAIKSEAKLRHAAIEKELAEAVAKSAKAKAAAKPAIAKLTKEIPAKRKAVAKGLSDLDDATLETLDTVKAKLDKDLAALKALGQAIRARSP